MRLIACDGMCRTMLLLDGIGHPSSVVLSSLRSALMTFLTNLTLLASYGVFHTGKPDNLESQNNL